MKKVFTIIAVIALIAVYAVFAMASSSSGSKTPSGTVSPSTETSVKPQETTSSTQATVTQTESDQTEDKTPIPEPTPEPTPNTSNDQLRINVGEKLTTKDIEITFASAGDYNETNQFLQPDAGYKYIYLYFECSNPGTSDKTISEFSFDCYADNNACKMYYSGDNALSGTMSPGRGTNGYVYFSVPVNAQSIEVEYEVNFWTNEKAIFVVK